MTQWTHGILPGPIESAPCDGQENVFISSRFRSFVSLRFLCRDKLIAARRCACCRRGTASPCRAAFEALARGTSKDGLHSETEFCYGFLAVLSKTNFVIFCERSFFFCVANARLSLRFRVKARFCDRSTVITMICRAAYHPR